MKKKLLVIGGTKYVGLELLTDLNQYDVYVLSRKEIYIPNIKYIKIDREDKLKLKEYIFDINPNIILDMICYTQEDALNIVSIIENLISLEHYIFISTFFIYNYSLEYEKFEELDIKSIEDRYTKNKYEAEKIIYKSGIFSKTSIVRFPFIFSHDDFSKRFQYLLNQTEVKIIDHLRCSFISKDDAVYALKILISKQPYGFIDISNQGSLSLKDIYIILEEILGIKYQFIYEKRDVYQIKKDICLNSEYKDLFSLQDVSLAFQNEFAIYLKKGKYQ
jgi:dTDP-4-dehydrorhamnose reductase